MFFRKKFTIPKDSCGFQFEKEEFVGLLESGDHMIRTWRRSPRVELSSMASPWVSDVDLEQVVRAGAFDERVQVLDLNDFERGLAWVDGRFDRFLGPGLHAVWTNVRDVRVERIDARLLRLARDDLALLLNAAGADEFLQSFPVPENWVGLLHVNGQFREVLDTGQHVFWKGLAKLEVEQVSFKEFQLDVSGQDIMTRDKVTLRVNAVVTARVDDPRKSVAVSEDGRQALYREAQLALRTVVGGRTLDEFLQDKEQVANEWRQSLESAAEALGLALRSVGVRDVILPGDMRELLNKVTEAAKAAEANFISRREETAAMRSQANTARLLENNPTLMRLRELESLERIAKESNLQLVLGEQGLVERISKLL